MARKLRVHYPGAVYHVIARGNNQEYILATDSDKNHYIELIKKYKKRFAFYLYGYVLMDNHVHLLLEVGEQPLSKIMQGIQQSYTQWYNHLYGRVGHVFQQRYQAILCAKDDYLITLLKYIHYNPIRAGIAATLDYPWSSHREYMLSGSPVIDSDFCLSIFSNQLPTALQKYLEFMEHRHPQDLKKEEIHKGINTITELDKENERPHLSLRIELGELIKIVMRKLELPAETLLELESKNRKMIMARNMVIYLALKHGIAERTVLMKKLKLSPYQVSRGFYAAGQTEEGRSTINELETTLQ